MRQVIPPALLSQARLQSSKSEGASWGEASLHAASTHPCEKPLRTSLCPIRCDQTILVKMMVLLFLWSGHEDNMTGRQRQKYSQHLYDCHAAKFHALWVHVAS